MIKTAALALSLIIGLSSFCFPSEDMLETTSYEGAVKITQEEYEYISNELQNGMSDCDIALELTYNAPANVVSYSGVKWIKSSGKWYCKTSDGKNITGFARINGVVYYMDSIGVMKTGWQYINSEWYFFASSGGMKTGWQKISKKWYYFDEFGIMQTGKIVIVSAIYILNTGGDMATGWKKYDNQWYYLTGSGAAKTSTWWRSNKTWYYFDDNGVMLTGLNQIDGAYYLFGSSGAMLKGWQKYDGEWYFFTSDGSAVEGWLLYNGSNYYIDETGMMLHDTEVDGLQIGPDGLIIQTMPEPKFNKDVEDGMIELINNLRKAAAVESQREYYVPVYMSESLRNDAHTRCKEIVNDFSHRSAAGVGRGDECCYKGDGNSNASAIFNTWKNSSAHKANLCGGCTARNKSAKPCGIGVYYYNGQTYAVYHATTSDSGTGSPSGYTPPT
ncbi:Putative cell wall binding repeat-containing protein [Ruminococcaceae bacterium YRB3002]|nr:Putative cell wall binding repeat-containing protein [Ruminococcaceae bacterium YRB3002]